MDNKLTPTRVRVAYACAIAVDALQLIAGPLGWTGVDEALDVAAAVATSAAIGFHPLLLPTFVVEFLPIVDMAPTWTACVAIVIALRRRQQRIEGPPTDGPVIDV